MQWYHNDELRLSLAFVCQVTRTHFFIFLRLPFAKFEHRILEFADYFDNILINFIDRIREH